MRVSVNRTTTNDIDAYYSLRGTCKGCRRVTWLCRRDRRCAKYATTPKRGHVARPTGYQPNASGQPRLAQEKQ